MRFAQDNLNIAVGTIFHNKAAEMKRMLHSISNEAVDQWFLVGGAFANSPNKDEWLDNATLEVLETFKKEQEEAGSRGIKLRVEIMEGANEYAKRMKYVDMCRQNDVNCLFIVDTDEYVYENEKVDWFDCKTNWEQFRRDIYANMIKYPDHNVFSTDIIQNEFLHKDMYPRIWNFPTQMSYVRGSHYKFGNPEVDPIDDVLFTHQASWGAVRGITLKHDHTLRTDGDMNNRRTYQDWLVQYEAMLDAEYDKRDIKEIQQESLSKVKPWNDNCMCFKCVVIKNMDPTKFFDPRPRNRREHNPYLTGIPL